MAKIKVTLSNSVAELAHRLVDNEEEARNAAIELIDSVPFLNDGDKITVVELDD